MDAKALLKASKLSSKRIDHPHIKYNSLGKISCIVCGVPIKSEITWKAHILSKTHKENAARGTDVLKRIHEQVKSHVLPAKQSKLEDVKSTIKDVESSDSKPQEVEFKVPDVPNKEKPKKEEKDEEVQKGVLPEGFFDDARKDAEARHVPFRDKMDEEMEAFQRELGVLNQESEQILEKDNEEMVVARNLAEVDKQIAMWEKVHELELLKEANLARKKIVKSEDAANGNKVEEVDEDDSDIDEDELNDFRFRSGVR
ncbi:unnamed protein product [Hymenolepis diminuta]|uniref:Zinc finger protein 830 n=1 Tax=Hymenolepis diminuta TaxID=6216 RepID=A0A0R3SK82_HYMDI|nr:unnamed protein product [Hymenolepis diminuta]VUZ50630.1 unnamed protein product [Hymenolepis diminuta]